MCVIGMLSFKGLLVEKWAMRGLRRVLKIYLIGIKVQVLLKFIYVTDAIELKENIK